LGLATRPRDQFLKWDCKFKKNAFTTIHSPQTIFPDD
jgi:hypothetical protein